MSKQASLLGHMRARVESKTFAKAMRIALPFASSNRTDNPICSGVRITAAAGTLTVEATDMDTKVVTSIDAGVQADGVTVAPAKLLEGFVRSVDGAVELETTDGDPPQLIVRCDPASLDMRTFPVDDWPEYRDVEGQEFDLSDVWTGMRRVMHAIGTTFDKSYPSRNVLRFEPKSDGQPPTIVAHSMRQLSYYEAEALSELKEGVNVPGAFLEAVARAADGLAEPVSARFGERLVSFRCGRTTWTSRTVSDAYPAWRRSIRPESPYNIVVGRQALLSCLTRLALLPEESGFRRIHIDKQDDQLILTATGPDVGTIVDVVPCSGTYEGAELMVVLGDLREVAEHANEDELDFGVVDPFKHLQLHEGPWMAMFTPVRPAGSL